MSAEALPNKGESRGEFPRLANSEDVKKEKELLESLAGFLEKASKHFDGEGDSVADVLLHLERRENSGDEAMDREIAWRKNKILQLLGDRYPDQVTIDDFLGEI